MTLRTVGYGLALALGLVAAAASADKQATSDRYIPLQIANDEQPFNDLNHRTFIDGFRCDADGNVFFVPGMPYDFRTGEPREVRTTVVRVSSDGALAIPFSLPDILAITKDEEASVSRISVDPRGNLHILAFVRAGSSGRQYLLSLTDEGKVRSRVAVDPEIHVTRFAAFETGEYLILGTGRDRAAHRIAIMTAAGDSLRDVSGPVASGSFEADATSWLTRHVDSLAVPAADGRVYLASRAGGPAYAVTRAGVVTKASDLAPPQPAAALIDLLMAGQRLAAIYEVRKQPVSDRWITVHDAGTGNKIATYGPVKSHVMCYRPEGSRDRFTLRHSKEGRAFFFNAIAP